ncbi:hypothetical protein ACOME3_009118 [Neoechinorhynchus agilis]
MQMILLVSISAAIVSWTSADVILRIYLGFQPLPWLTNLFRLYAFYYMIIGINGLTECILQATASVQKLNDQRTQMTLNGLCFLLLSSTISQMRLDGTLVAHAMVLLKTASMIMRIWFNCSYVIEWQKLYGIHTRLPFLIDRSCRSISPRTIRVMIVLWLFSLVFSASTSNFHAKSLFSVSILGTLGLVIAYEESHCLLKFVPDQLKSLLNKLV